MTRIKGSALTNKYEMNPYDQWVASQIKVFRKYNPIYVYANDKERDIEKEIELQGYEFDKVITYRTEYKGTEKIQVKDYATYTRR